MSAELPKQTDSLFLEETDPKKGAWITNPTNKFFLYSEGYREAGYKLYDYCVENNFFANADNVGLAIQRNQSLFNNVTKNLKTPNANT